MELLSSLGVVFGGAFALGAVVAWLFRKRPGWLSIASIVVLASWPLWTMLSQATTCTMGDDDSWETTLALCALLAGLATPMLAASGETWRRHRAAVPFLTLAPLLFFVSHMLETGFGAHHLCGPAYDGNFAYGTYSVDRARLFYPVMWGAGLFLTALAFVPLFRQRLSPSPPP